MKITIEMADGFERVLEIDEEEDKVVDLGSTKKMLQAEIDDLKEANRDKASDVVFYHEANKECQKTIEDLRKKADGWEKRCAELEQELREAQEAKQDMAKDIEYYHKKLREQRDGLDLSGCTVKELSKTIDELEERIYQQDVTIAKYDDENRELKAKYIAWDRGSTAMTRWAQAIHENAVIHGWWAKSPADAADFHSPADAGESCADGDRPLPEILMLCVCELAESMEEYRNGKPLIYDGEDGKPEGIAVEMVDCMIRILDWMGHNGVDVDELIRKKHEYNKGRPYRHGGKKA